MEKLLSEMSLEELWELFPVVLKEHNPKYKKWYIKEQQELIRIIGQKNIKRINHIGSTAVEGLLAKPIIDILLEIDESYNVEFLKTILHKADWICMSSEIEPVFQLSLNKGYTLNGFAEKVFHLHVRYFDDWNELYFRDYLMEHKDVAIEYSNLKSILKGQYAHNRDEYTNQKTDFILQYSNIAKEEYGDRYV